MACGLTLLVRLTPEVNSEAEFFAPVSRKLHLIMELSDVIVSGKTDERAEDSEGGDLVKLVPVAFGAYTTFAFHFPVTCQCIGLFVLTRPP
jgi:hypothetical protein